MRWASCSFLDVRQQPVRNSIETTLRRDRGRGLSGDLRERGVRFCLSVAESGRSAFHQRLSSAYGSASGRKRNFSFWCLEHGSGHFVGSTLQSNLCLFRAPISNGLYGDLQPIDEELSGPELVGLELVGTLSQGDFSCAFFSFLPPAPL
jgi:hypothetical protein